MNIEYMKKGMAELPVSWFPHGESMYCLFFFFDALTKVSDGPELGVDLWPNAPVYVHRQPFFSVGRCRGFSLVSV